MTDFKPFKGRRVTASECQGLWKEMGYCPFIHPLEIILQQRRNRRELYCVEN